MSALHILVMALAIWRSTRRLGAEDASFVVGQRITNSTDLPEDC